MNKIKEFFNCIYNFYKNSKKYCICLIFISFFSILHIESSDFSTKQIFVDKYNIIVEIAKTTNQRIKGLSKRKNLDSHKGMLFIFETPRILSFWMKDTTIPLSIAFINSENAITSIYDMEPLSLKTVSSNIPCLYALEMKKDWFEKHSVTKGMKISFEDN